MFRLRSVGVLSSAKIFAVVQGAIGILIGFVLLIAALVGASIAPGQQKLGMVGMIVIALLIPVVYAAIGFVGGAIWAAVYNLAAQAIGGLELELEMPPATIITSPTAPVPSA
jgi:hypothetical protein